jgi:hypothetical protein
MHMKYGSSPIATTEKKRWEYKATKPKRAKTYDKAKLVKTMQLNPINSHQPYPKRAKTSKIPLTTTFPMWKQ